MIFVVIFSVVLCLTYFYPAAGLIVAAHGYLLPVIMAGGSGSAGEVEGGLDSVVAVFAVLLICIGRFVFSGFRRARVPYTVYHFFFMMLTPWLIITSLWSPSQLVSIENTMKFVFLSALYFFLVVEVFLNFYKDQKKAFLDFSLGLLGTALACAVIIIVNPDVTTFYGRVTIGGLHPIPVSLLLMSGIVSMIYISLRYPNSMKIKLGLMLVLCAIGYAFFMTNTRGPLVALFFVVLLLVLKLRRVRWGYVAGVVASLIAIPLIIASLPDEAVSSVADRFGLLFSDDKGESINDRQDAWRVAIALFLENPIAGVEFSGFSFYHALPYPHNLFLEILCELGLIGFLCIFPVVLNFIRVVMGRFTKSKELILAVIMFLFFFIEAQVSFTLWMHKMLYVSMGLLAVAELSVKRNMIDV